MNEASRGSNPQKLTVHVTQKHIHEGRPNACGSCPIALALQEQHPREEKWGVGRGFAGEWDSRKVCYKLEYRLPEQAIHFIHRFDMRRKVKPFTFEMERV